MNAVADGYRRWAALEAHGSSAQYEAWALAVAADGELCERISALPREKRQPNLLFAAARVHGASADTADFPHWLGQNWDAVCTTVLTRINQTNEPARCASLLMALSQIPGPIALLELGASAGLCLIPDRYRYRFLSDAGVHELRPRNESRGVTLECSLMAVSSPTSLPHIVWRAGIDRSSVDLQDAEELLWFESLVWPEHDERRVRLRDSLRLLAESPPRVVQGDLLEYLPSIAAEAPSEATLVIMHSAVFAYLDEQQRQLAQTLIDRTGARHVSLEGASVMTSVLPRLPSGVLDDPRFVLALDGVPMGMAAPHGGSYEALPLS
ncbi:DUF2332 domain-containing protein [Chryseoglobus sp. 28M-23]|nr:MULTISPECIES: DUF2332 domain-containing protein [Microcella]QOD94114.1 DUF2332 domain-containing protein [Chryseoglobus sp. 28M-23]